MADDSFIQEVNEQIREERARALWGRYGPIIIAGAVLLIVLTGIYQFYNSWQEKKANKLGDMLLSVISLEQQGQFELALTQLQSLKEQAGSSAYKILAIMHEAMIAQKQGDYRKAISLFDKAAQGAAKIPVLEYIAKMRAAYILLDHGSLSEVEQHVTPWLNSPMQASAYEILGYAQWRAGKNDQAMDSFKKVLEQSTNVQGRTQARIMLDLLENDTKFRNITPQPNAASPASPSSPSSAANSAKPAAQGPAVKAAP